MPTRFFVVESSSIKLPPGYQGRFETSALPCNVASKVTRQLFSMAGKRTKRVTFSIRETTMGSQHKTYKYVGTKQKLTKPKVVTRGGQTFTIKHRYVATRVAE